MRTPSRRMPRRLPTPVWAWPLTLALIGAFAGWVFLYPWTLVLLGIIATAILLENRRLKRMAARRPQESICTFARSFNRRTADTWIIRAVYEGFSRQLGNSGLPLRRKDRWQEDLRLDSDDLEDIVIEAAFRSGRSLETPEQNPHYARLHTVGDIVEFLSYQPLKSTRTPAKP